MTNVAIEPVDAPVASSCCTSSKRAHHRALMRYQGCLITAAQDDDTSRAVYQFCVAKLGSSEQIRLVQQLSPSIFLLLLNHRFDVDHLVKRWGQHEGGPYSIKPFDKDTYQALLVFNYFKDII